MKKALAITGVCVAMVCGHTFAQQAANPKPKEAEDDTRLGVVLDLERPSNTDILLLRNGDKLTGTVLNESFSIRTSYAKLEFNNRMIAGIDLEGGANNIESIITVNNNRFSGFIDDPVFVFKLQRGTQIEVRREKCLKVIFRVRDAERRGIPQRQFLVLKNGDYFSGHIQNDELVVSTTYAKVPVKLGEAESITLIGGQNPLTKVVLRNSDQLQGVLETEDIEVQLDVGTDVSIYKDRIDVIYCREGFIPDLATIHARGGIIKLGDSKSIGYYSESTGNGVKITELVENSPAHRAGLRIGDIVVTVDGQQIKDDTAILAARDKVVAGTKPQTILGVQRGNETLVFRVVK